MNLNIWKVWWEWLGWLSLRKQGDHKVTIQLKGRGKNLLASICLVNYHLVDVLLNSKVTMLMMSTRTIKGFMHLVIGSKNY
jgi:hypothetical protein